MLTTNFYASSAASFGFGGASNPITKMKDINGNLISNTSSSTSPYLFPDRVPSTQEYSGTMLLFGSGTNEESELDYNISFIGGLSSTLGSLTYVTNGLNITGTRRIVVNNPTNSAVTITEFAIQNHMSLSSGYGFFIIFRKKLDEPFILESNETVNFDLSITYSLPYDYVPYVGG